MWFKNMREKTTSQNFVLDIVIPTMHVIQTRFGAKFKKYLDFKHACDSNKIWS